MNPQLPSPAELAQMRAAQTSIRNALKQFDFAEISLPLVLQQRELGKTIAATYAPQVSAALRALSPDYSSAAAEIALSVSESLPRVDLTGVLALDGITDVVKSFGASLTSQLSLIPALTAAAALELQGIKATLAGTAAIRAALEGLEVTGITSMLADVTRLLEPFHIDDLFGSQYATLLTSAVSGGYLDHFGHAAEDDDRPRRSGPPNLHELLPLSIDDIRPLTAEGVMVWGAPRTEIVQELLAASTSEERRAVLADRCGTILQDCLDVADRGAVAEFANAGFFLRQGIVAVQEGHIAAGQSLLANVLETLLENTLGKDRNSVLHRDDHFRRGTTPEAIVMTGVRFLYRNYKLVPDQRGRSQATRHGLAHQLDPVHISPANAAVLALASASMIEMLVFWSGADRLRALVPKKQRAVSGSSAGSARSRRRAQAGTRPKATVVGQDRPGQPS